MALVLKRADIYLVSGCHHAGMPCKLRRSCGLNAGAARSLEHTSVSYTNTHEKDVLSDSVLTTKAPVTVKHTRRRSHCV